ncbi:uncharacterized protein LOC143288488 [Babylonia areolata]|uniref:uncharacterized protein LOC143288488 n=1 Tax=Babylonia areolata TaxID=304850 RepID=UPI003FD4891D
MEWTVAGLAWKIGAVFFAIILCTQRLSNVLTLDALVTFITTAWLTVFAKNWLSSALPEYPVDALHEYLLVHITAVLMVPALAWFLCTDPGDITIRTAIAVSRTLAFGIATVVTIVALHDELFDFETFQYILMPFFILAIVYAIQLYYNNAVNADKRIGNLNTNLHMDLSLSVLCGLVCLFVPFLPANYLFGQELDELHIYLYRLYGAMTLGYSGLPYIAPKFRTSANKRAVLFSRALCLLVTLLVTFRKYRRGDIPEGNGSKLFISILTILTLPAAIGSMRHEHAPGLDLPWRGLRIPHVGSGGTPSSNIFSATKKLTKTSPRRRRKVMGRRRSRRRNSRRSKSRGRSRSRRRR